MPPKENKNLKLKLVRKPALNSSLKPVTRADAVNETLRVMGLAPELRAARLNVAKAEEQLKRLKESELAKKRAAFRLEMWRTNPFAMVTDEQVDRAIAAREGLRNQHQLTQGSDKLANQYATVSNFYTALGSPNMMPMNEALVRANPYIASTLLNFGLNNPALTILSTAAPTGAGSGAFGTARTAFQTGMQAAKPTAVKVVQATGNAAKAAGTAIVQNAPRVAGNMLVLGVPATAYAGGEFRDENSNAQEEGSAMPWILGAGAAIGGYALYKNWGKGISRPNWLTWWERNPNAVAADARFNILKDKYNAALKAGDQTAMNALKTELGYETNAMIEQGGQMVDNPKFVSDFDLGEIIQYRLYPPMSGYIIESPGAPTWRKVRNGLRIPLYAIAGGNAAYGIYNLTSGPSNTPRMLEHPTREDYARNYLDTDQSIEPVDTLIVTPRDSVPLVVVDNGIIWSTRQ